MMAKSVGKLPLLQHPNGQWQFQNTGHVKRVFFFTISNQRCMSGRCIETSDVQAPNLLDAVFWDPAQPESSAHQ